MVCVVKPDLKLFNNNKVDPELVPKKNLFTRTSANVEVKSYIASLFFNYYEFFWNTTKKVIFPLSEFFRALNTALRANPRKEDINNKIFQTENKYLSNRKPDPFVSFRLHSRLAFFH